MANNDKAFNQLRILLEGKTIAQVLPPDASEAICKFVMADGSAFRLHATDLGYWIEETIVGNGRYTSLDSLIRDYYHHTYNFNYDARDATIRVVGHLIEVAAPDGRKFFGNIPSFCEYEQRIANHPEGRKILEGAVCMDDVWRTMFTERYSPKCPKELLWKS